METGPTHIRKPLLFCAVTAVSAAAALGACWRLAELGAGETRAGIGPGPAEAEATTTSAAFPES
jgi:hypothetical protein